MVVPRRMRFGAFNWKERMRHLEDQLQKAIIQYWDFKYPKWTKRLHHSPNGGKRNAIEASKFKQMGVRAGFPDLILLIPNRFYPFCGIELKAKTGRQSENQKPIKRNLRVLGRNMLLFVH